MYLHEHANIIGDPKHCDTLLLYESDKSTIYAQVTGKFMDVIIMNVSTLYIMPRTDLLSTMPFQLQNEIICSKPDFVVPKRDFGNHVYSANKTNNNRCIV